MFPSRVDFQDFTLIWTKPQIQKHQNPPRFVGLGVQNRVHLPNICLSVHLPQRDMHVELSARGVQVLVTEVSPSSVPYCRLPAPSSHPSAGLSPLVLGEQGPAPPLPKIHQHLPCAPALPSSPPANVVPSIGSPSGDMTCPCQGNLTQLYFFCCFPGCFSTFLRRCWILSVASSTLPAHPTACHQ